MTKINGVSLVSINGEIDSSNVSPVAALGANWAAVIPFAFMPSHTKPELSFDLKWQWKGERIDGIRNYIRELHAQNIAVMVKPQIWIGHGTYTGEMKMDSNKDWEELEVNYTEYILAFAKVAQEEGAEMLCIGTELKHFAEQRSDYWADLIKEIREIYTGKLTYAANWDDYDRVPFWSNVDYIGIDAYFPVADQENVSGEKLEAGWKSHKDKMDTFSDGFDRPILFTEYGYRSVSNCAVRPWDYSEDGAVNEKAQQLALKTLYNVFWQDDNYVGGFLWKWYPNHSNAGGAKDKMFTVQNKRAEKTVREIYSM
ncbi:MAG: glycoside hydrolase TIM-barrel-like domain-containing protein [Crocinitomicaceae bacterium]